MENYFQYLDQVLGLKSVVLPVREAAPILEHPEAVQAQIQVLFLAENPWSSKADELFQRMREAMKLSPDSVQVLFVKGASVPELNVQALAANRVVCFSKRIYESLEIESSGKFLTHDPEELIKQPELKKSTWEDLKQVMKSLGLRA